MAKILPGWKNSKAMQSMVKKLSKKGKSGKKLTKKEFEKKFEKELKQIKKILSPTRKNERAKAQTTKLELYAMMELRGNEKEEKSISSWLNKLRKNLDAGTLRKVKYA